MEPERAALSAEQEKIAQLEQENADLKTALALLRQDQQAGCLVQQSLLPENPSQLNGWHFDYWVRPSLYLSGDFVDAWAPCKDKVLFYLADVSGHGASSAFVTILLKYLLVRYAEQYGCSPAALCRQVNQSLLKIGLEKHLTLVLGCVDAKAQTLTYTLAAHLPAPLVVDAQGQVSELTGKGMPIGLFPDAAYQEYTCAFSQQARLCVASDGVLELLSGQGLEARQQEWHRLVEKTRGEITALRSQLPPESGRWPDDVTLMTLTGC